MRLSSCGGSVRCAYDASVAGSVYVIKGGGGESWGKAPREEDVGKTLLLRLRVTEGRGSWSVHASQLWGSWFSSAALQAIGAFPDTHRPTRLLSRTRWRPLLPH